MKPIRKILLAAALLFALSAAVLAAAGDAADPLITLSRLRTVYLEETQQKARQRAEALSAALRQRLEEQGEEAKRQLALVSAQPLIEAAVQRLQAQGVSGGAGQIVALQKGDVITGPLGAGFVVRQGTAEIVGSELVNITAGGARPAGRAIANNIYYLIPQSDGSGVRVTSDSAKAQLMDGAKVVSQSGYQAQYTLYAQALNVMGLFKGTDLGYELERQPTRLETLIMLIRLLGEEEEALNYEGSHPFTDVTGWPQANNYIAYALDKGYTNGVSASEFGPNNPANAATLYTYILRALGYSDAAGDFVWNETDRLKAVEIGLLTQSQMETIQQGEFYRDQAAFLCWQSLGAPLKGSDTPLRQKLIQAGAVSQSQYDQAKELLALR